MFWSVLHGLSYFTNSFLCLYHFCSTIMEMANTSQINKEQNRIDKNLGIVKVGIGSYKIMRLSRLLRLKPTFVRQQLPCIFQKTLLPRYMLIQRVST